jgi:hypothetical protein
MTATENATKYLRITKNLVQDFIKSLVQSDIESIVKDLVEEIQNV